MKCLLSHATAFEYWRLVGMRGIPVPERSAERKAPAIASASTIIPLAQTGLLSFPIHITTSQKIKRTAHAVYHYRPEDFPQGSIFLLPGNIGITSPELTLMQIARSFATPELAGLASEFCGFYSPSDSLQNGLIKREQLTTATKFSHFLANADNMSGAPAARAASRFVLDRSRSPMETAIALILTLPRALGGYAACGAVVNHRVAIGTTGRKAVNIPTLEPDILWPKSKLCIEYDSTEFHSDPHRLANDAKRKNALLAAGYKTIAITSKQARSSLELEHIARHVLQQQGRRQRMPEHDRAMKLQVDLLGMKSVLKHQYEPSRRHGQISRDSDLGR